MFHCWHNKLHQFHKYQSEDHLSGKITEVATVIPAEFTANLMSSPLPRPLIKMLLYERAFADHGPLPFLHVSLKMGFHPFPTFSNW